MRQDDFPGDRHGIRDGGDSAGAGTGGPHHPARGGAVHQKAFDVPGVILLLILVFAAVQAWRDFLMTPAENYRFLLRYAFLPLRYSLPPDVPISALPGGLAAALLGPFTHMFLHAGWLHLLANSLWMAAFGAPVARRTGALRFVMLMLVSAAGGALLYLVMHWGEPALLIGASGGVSGLMGAAIRLIYADGASLSEGLHRDLTRVRPLTVLQTFLLPRPRAFILIWMGVNLLFGVFGVGSGGRMNAIAWEAHMGGFLTGLIFFSLFDRSRTPRLENGPT